MFLNGALMGFSRKEMESKYDDIVDFAELPEFMDQKLKNYSSGMQVRLAFAIAIQSNSDILILDEVLAVGDEAFQRKCNDFFQKVKEDKTKTVVLVTHSMGSVKKYCDKALLIKDGDIVINGSPDDVANEYSLENLETKKVTAKKDEKNEIVEDFKLELLSPKRVSQNEDVKIKFSYRLLKDHTLNTLVYLNDDNKNCYLIGGRSMTAERKAGDIIEDIVSFNLSQLNDATIKVGAEIWDSEKNIIAYIPHEGSPLFMIRRTDYEDNTENYSVIHGYGRWQNEKRK